MSTGPISSKPEGFPGGSVVKNLPANVRDARDKGDMSSIPELRRSPGGGNGNPLQYACLENLMDRRAWWAIIHKVTKSRRGLKWLSMHVAWLWTAVSVLFEFSTLRGDSHQKQSPLGSCKPERVLGTWIISFHALTYAQKCISSFLVL